MIKLSNIPMHGEVSSTNASNGVEITVYPIGSTTAHTLEDNEFFVITDVIISSSAGGLTSIFCDTDNTPTTIGSGETIISVTLPANGVQHVPLKQPFIAPVGKPLIFKTPSGQSNCQVFGSIRSNPNSTLYPTYPVRD